MAFISTPDLGGNRRHEIEDLRRSGGVVRQPHGTQDSLGDIGDDAVSPSADLIPEETETSWRFRSDRPLHDNPASCPVIVRDRRLLDHEAALRRDDHESRVIEVAWTSVLNTRADRLEEPSAQLHDVLPRAQRDPVKV